MKKVKTWDSYPQKFVHIWYNVSTRILCVTVITMLNAAPASSSVDLSEAYSYTDLLCVNETEVRGKSN